MTPIARLARRTARLPAAALPACLALCIALLACAQPPPPSPATPSPAPPSVATLTPTPQPTASPTPAAQPNSDAALVSTPTFAQPPADIAFTQVTAGKAHACGLRENGAAACWGRNSEGQSSPPQDVFSQISAGLQFTCGLRQDATIACWGLNSDRQTNSPQGAFSELAAGLAHTCAIPISQGSPSELVCWGGAFPDGAETLQLDTPISNIQSGPAYTCGLTPQGDMVCAQMVERATEVTPGPFIQLAAGLDHVCALREDGSAFCQGDNTYLQSTPPPTKFVQISAGRFHSCGITQARVIECWGSSVPAAPGERLDAPGGEFVAISAAWRNSCALRPSGQAVCWLTGRYRRSAAPETPSIPDGVSLAFGGAKFQFPVDIFPWPSGGLAIVHREAFITVRHDRPDAPPPRTVLDITDRAVVCCEISSSMLSAALDPQFEDFPFLYVWYRILAPNALGEGEPGFVGRLARFRVENDVVLKDSELPILDVPLPNHLHIDGAVRFGADGMLYQGIGDNGTGIDVQDLNNFRGKIIRIDVRGANAAQPYRIPPDNPFMDTPGAFPEIWAYGMRNPWRMAFDPKNPSNIFVADTGKQTREEVSIATAGANLGWPYCEGDICRDDADPAILATLTPPLVAYDSRTVGCAIIGGVTVPWLDDGFIFSDLCARRIWLLERDNLSDKSPDGAQKWRMREIADLADAAPFIVAFGAGNDGSVYILTFDNPILRLDPSFADNLPDAPADQ